ncbi:hypothetical protein HPB49_011608 [Dermacentor silvarum]|uniref:Uncharacterized protein n=1 Tax=Dermacentor silvarum TaxID=543639 RepID=A0ACB8DCU2_DERSI|nr:hypothetical protein HPB49_011608 [Dermacentor silvarum]
MLIPVQPYYRTILACGKGGVVGHRMDTCANPRPDMCGLCGQQIPLVEDGVRVPHECVPVCSVCGGAHTTNSRACTAKYRKSTVAAQRGGKFKMTTKKRHQLQRPGGPPRWDIAKTDKAAPPTGGVGKQPSTPPPPHGGIGKQPTAPPCCEAGAWANTVKNGNQVSGGRQGCLLMPPYPTPCSAEQNIIANLQVQIEALQKRLAAAKAKETQPVSLSPQ